MLVAVAEEHTLLVRLVLAVQAAVVQAQQVVVAQALLELPT